MVDVWKYRKWALPFVWIGMNPITIYMIHNLVDVEKIARRFAGGDLNRLYFGQYGDLAIALVEIGITFGVARFMYERKIFLRI